MLSVNPIKRNSYFCLRARAVDRRRGHVVGRARAHVAKAPAGSAGHGPGFGTSGRDYGTKGQKGGRQQEEELTTSDHRGEKKNVYTALDTRKKRETPSDVLNAVILLHVLRVKRGRPGKTH